MFGSFDVTRLICTYIIMTYRRFAYCRWCRFVVGWWKIRYSLTFYFVYLNIA
jgi:hypothetical protein